MIILGFFLLISIFDSLQFHRRKKWTKCNVNNCENYGDCRYDTRLKRLDTICICKSGFIGSRCQFINPCATNHSYLSVCLNGGRCIPIGSELTGYEAKCLCPSGYKGDFCENIFSAECTEQVCNGGVCQYRKNKTEIFCDCPLGRHGDRCQYIDHCYLGNPCQNDGICMMLANEYKCSCLIGWTGQNCSEDVDECKESQPCSNNGMCVNTVGSFRCECQKGWTKDRQCRKWTSPCSDNPCKNDGQCRFDEFTYEEICECPNGFEGSFCQIRAPGCSNCENGGKCEYVNESRSFQCSCPSGFTGKKCEIQVDPCDGNEYKCKNGGICSSEMSRLSPEKIKCTCPPGYQGDLCNDPFDFCSVGKSKCKNGANCISTLTGFKCICFPGYKGELCENNDPCAIYPCANNGTCISFGSNEFTCRCPFEFRGQHCEEHWCPCLNGGRCSLKGQCDCSDGYYGEHCEYKRESLEKEIDPIISLNLSINHRNHNIRDSVVDVFKWILEEKFEPQGSKLGQINVTKCDSELYEDDNCVRILFRIPEHGAITDTLNRIRAIRNLPTGLQLTDVRALVQGGRSIFLAEAQSSQPKTHLIHRMFIGIGIGAMSGILLISLIAVIRTQAIIKSLKCSFAISGLDYSNSCDENRKRTGYRAYTNSDHPDDSKRSRKSITETFSLIKESLLRLWTQADIDYEATRSLLENERALVCSILNCPHSIDQDKAARLSETIEMSERSKNSRLAFKMLSCVNERNGESALHLAAHQKLIQCSQLLLVKYPALCKCRDKLQRTPLHIAASSDFPAIVRIMVELSQGFANLNAVDSYGRTPLQQAVLGDSVSAVECLIALGAKVDIVTSGYNYNLEGASALHLAAEVDSLECIDLLVNHGASVNTTNNDRATPLIFAIRNNNCAAAKLLVSYGAKINLLTSFNESPLSLATNSTKEMLLLIKQALVNEKANRRTMKRSRKRSSAMLSQTYVDAAKKRLLQQNEKKNCNQENYKKLAIIFRDQTRHSILQSSIYQQCN
ncbi:hypothetical protein ACOME3_002686 [Neoechinorhynchus agilis]